MLQHLQQLHSTILAQLDELDRLTSAPTPPMDRLPSVRLALTRASRARTLFLDRHHREILAAAPPARRMAIAALRQAMSAQLDASAKHIGRWTLREITGDWSGYCQASAAMRAAMRRRVQEEASVLYPVLSALPLDRSVA